MTCVIGTLDRCAREICFGLNGKPQTVDLIVTVMPISEAIRLDKKTQVSLPMAPLRKMGARFHQFWRVFSNTQSFANHAILPTINHCDLSVID